MSSPTEPTEEPVPSLELEADDEILFDDTQGDAAVEWTHLPPEREFVATPYDPPVKTLIQEMKDGDLVVRPTFQRYGVWDQVRQSKFIESILLNIPVPTLFFAEDDDQTKVVVDGQQRLTALRAFNDGDLTLKGLEVLAALNGKKVDMLTERQQRMILNRTLRCLLISAKSDSEIRFQVFERLNQGGMPLNAQEVRHCVFRGPLNDLLHDLVKGDEWLPMFGLDAPHLRMTDCELVLRFFALRAALPDYKPPLKKLLNDYMRDSRKISESDIASLRQIFYSALRPVHAAFGRTAFRRFILEGGKARLDRQPNRAVFDAQMLTMEGMDPDWARENRRSILEAFIDLTINDTRFVDSVSKATADKTRLNYRLRAWADALEKKGAVLPFIGRIPA